MAIGSSSGFFRLRPGAFHIASQDTTYTSESGIKNNKQTRTWVSPKRKKGEVFGTLLALCAVTSVYSNKIPTQPQGALTHPLALADLASGSTGPNFSPSSRLSLTVLFPWLSLLLTALGPCLSSSSSGLVGHLTRKPFMWVSRQIRQRNPDWRSPTETNAPPSYHNSFK